MQGPCDPSYMSVSNASAFRVLRRSCVATGNVDDREDGKKAFDMIYDCVPAQMEKTSTGSAVANVPSEQCPLPAIIVSSRSVFSHLFMNSNERWPLKVW